jgi:hypothetical protein
MQDIVPAAAACARLVVQELDTVLRDRAQAPVKQVEAFLGE